MMWPEIYNRGSISHGDYDTQHEESHDGRAHGAARCITKRLWAVARALFRPG
jgi:hypothetical protein